jgi:hypothetical protein
VHKHFSQCSLAIAYIFQGKGPDNPVAIDGNPEVADPLLVKIWDVPKVRLVLGNLNPITPE